MRTFVVSGIVVLLVIFAWSPGTIAEQPPAPRGEVRIVDKRTSNRFTIDQNRMEALVRHTDDGTLVPSLARSWHWVDDRALDIHLRQGVTFHNGEVFDAEIVKRNLELWRELRKYYEKPGLLKLWWHLPVESRIDILNPYTIRLVLPAPDAETLLRLRFQWIGNRQFHRTLDNVAKKNNRLPVTRFWSLIFPFDAFVQHRRWFPLDGSCNRI